MLDIGDSKVFGRYDRNRMSPEAYLRKSFFFPRRVALTFAMGRSLADGIAFGITLRGVYSRW